ncbi:MAG: hypothetical protein K1000chlam2_01258 [Chlamydiae bacterium]|nr:hypothetical protein [Chlamydiota bacterium]
MRNRSFLFLIVFVFLLLSLPKSSADKIRSWTICAISPSWKLTGEKDVEKLELENQMLKGQIRELKSWVLENAELEGQFQELRCITAKAGDPFFERRSRYLAQILQRSVYSLPARVVFREPASWSSSIWLNVGERDNERIGKEIVAKNSPVVVGKAIVGVVEEVTKTRCLVRLITDQSLTPSVRAVRGGEQNRDLAEALDTLVKKLSLQNHLEGSQELVAALRGFQAQLDLDESASYLAKGQLHGTSHPLWRSLGQTLKGVGFNYDFSDEEGSAVNLRTGVYKNGIQQPLIRTGDLLITTGMDGIFPPDLRVGIVTKILPLHEGECSYQLEADALIPNLNTLSEVFVLPPI